MNDDNQKKTRLSTTLGSVDRMAAIEGDGDIEHAKMTVASTDGSAITLQNHEIVELFYLLKKGFDRKILQS